MDDTGEGGVEVAVRNGEKNKECIKRKLIRQN